MPFLLTTIAGLSTMIGTFLIFIAIYQTYEYIKNEKRHTNKKNSYKED